jgi:hypothetical protein
LLVAGLGLWTATTHVSVLIGARPVDLVVLFAPVLVFATFLLRRHGLQLVPLDPITSPLDRRITVPTAIVSAVAAWILRGPSPDDTLYGNLAITVAEHPFEPLLRRDGIFGLGVPSPMLRPYFFHGVEPLAGIVSWFTGIDALVVLHAGLPPLFGVAVALVQFELGRTLLPAHRHAVGIGALIVLLLFADGWQSHGSHGYAASAMGRALLVNGLLPVVFLATLRVHTVAGTAPVVGLSLALFAAAGASSNGLALGPLCVLSTHVGMSGIRGWNMTRTRRVLLAIAPIVLVAVWAYAYRSPLHPAAPFDGGQAMREVMERAFGGPWALAVAVMGIAGGIATMPAGPHRRTLAVIALILLVLVANPWIPGWLNRIVVREGMLPRLWLLVPTPALLATAMIGLSARTGVPPRAAGLAGVAFLAAILFVLPLRGPVDDPWHPDPRRLLNVYPTQYQTALRLASMTAPEDVVLVPPWASIYVPTVRGHPKLFYARELYEGYLADRLGSEEASRRRRLALFVEGNESVDAYTPVCEDFDGIDLILTRSRAARAREILRGCGWQNPPDAGDRDLWTRPRSGASQGPPPSSFLIFWLCRAVGSATPVVLEGTDSKVSTGRREYRSS